MIRGQSFDKISNWLLVIVGVFLLVYQLNEYFTSHTHSENQLESQEIRNKQLIKLDANYDDHNH